MNKETEKIKNEVLRKIGRNIMIFQQIEHMLKYILANGEVSGYAGEFKEKHDQKINTIDKQTMGQLVGQYMKTSLSSSEKETIWPEESKKIWFSTKYSFVCGSDYYEKRKKSFGMIVEERNQLVHQLLPLWDMHSISSSAEIEQFLDKQREKVLPEFDFLKGQLKTMLELRKEVAEYMASEEGKKQLFTLPRLRQSQLTAWLFDIAEKHSRPDGWMVLDAAAHLIQQGIPQEITGLEKKYGYKKLKGFMLATEYFDLNEEPTDKGAIRVLYRVKPDLKFDD